jgi:hypothetical protein|tara:strand:- start:2090 stop:2200 length:111 start_codon:yes stop_codon:yes gene_type:complete
MAMEVHIASAMTLPWLVIYVLLLLLDTVLDGKMRYK